MHRLFLGHLKAPKTSVNIGVEHLVSLSFSAGYVGLVNDDFVHADLVLGEEVDLYSWQNGDARGTEAVPVAQLFGVPRVRKIFHSYARRCATWNVNRSSTGSKVFFHWMVRLYGWLLVSRPKCDGCHPTKKNTKVRRGLQQMMSMKQFEAEQ